jgi:hypothetical protein
MPREQWADHTHSGPGVSLIPPKSMEYQARLHRPIAVTAAAAYAFCRTGVPHDKHHYYYEKYTYFTADVGSYACFRRR